MLGNNWNTYLQECSHALDAVMAKTFKNDYAGRVVKWEGIVKKVNNNSVEIILSQEKSLESEADLLLHVLSNRLKKNNSNFVIGKKLKFKAKLLSYKDSKAIPFRAELARKSAHNEELDLTWEQFSNVFRTDEELTPEFQFEKHWKGHELSCRMNVLSVSEKTHAIHNHYEAIIASDTANLDRSNDAVVLLMRSSEIDHANYLREITGRKVGLICRCVRRVPVHIMLFDDFDANEKISFGNWMKKKKEEKEELEKKMLLKEKEEKEKKKIEEENKAKEEAEERKRKEEALEKEKEEIKRLLEEERKKVEELQRTLEEAKRQLEAKQKEEEEKKKSEEEEKKKIEKEEEKQEKQEDKDKLLKEENRINEIEAETKDQMPNDTNSESQLPTLSKSELLPPSHSSLITSSSSSSSSPSPSSSSSPSPSSSSPSSPSSSSDLSISASTSTPQITNEAYRSSSPSSSRSSSPLTSPSSSSSHSRRFSFAAQRIQSYNSSAAVAQTAAGASAAASPTSASPSSPSLQRHTSHGTNNALSTTPHTVSPSGSLSPSSSTSSLHGHAQSYPISSVSSSSIATPISASVQSSSSSSSSSSNAASSSSSPPATFTPSIDYTAPASSVSAMREKFNKSQQPIAPSLPRSLYSSSGGASSLSTPHSTRRLSGTYSPYSASTTPNTQPAAEKSEKTAQGTIDYDWSFKVSEIRKRFEKNPEQQ
ncbi:uncharacterized protein MONOS_6475 [Monocercomonoides exilis]|uniref:uncharacterized protein n=1 Tax=Monocercomonoides exilis TaxID=2049356 RepID=UPI00355A1395|nr:hypothetical protein MONOS_6475 [Monocercomonoides exilis]|eukprot:MONOS_6475.1-p1 / transcript=MONOS_6475.1 / gene=MONOS_6475 / organism=Monocercomonoides_exilis_PA203 / gene_product=unspecified product / transcript_product=unspecified product / location=Mono_scaffold00204:51425-53618(-) / protein_length=709 / sequence_SO=supercontig / SO=protein_coding / is_pseudo=false